MGEFDQHIMSDPNLYTIPDRTRGSVMSQAEVDSLNAQAMQGNKNQAAGGKGGR
jgi:hypothetical protein